MIPELKKLVYIDDAIELLTLVQACLGTESYQLETYDSSITALPNITADPPQLILLDVMMPEMDGIETMTHLHANPVTKQIPIILFTATADLDICPNVGNGVIEVIAKPFSIMTLADEIQACWQQYHTQGIAS